MDKVKLRSIAGTLQSVLLDILLEGDITAPTITVGLLRQVANDIEADKQSTTAARKVKRP